MDGWIKNQVRLQRGPFAVWYGNYEAYVEWKGDHDAYMRHQKEKMERRWQLMEHKEAMRHRKRQRTEEGKRKETEDGRRTEDGKGQKMESEKRRGRDR